jgi:Holliday junction resolvase RusA-like endonuclease
VNLNRKLIEDICIKRQQKAKMKNVFLKISGIPYGKKKVRGNVGAPKAWSCAIIEQTKHLEKIKEPCVLYVVFYLPKNKYPKDLPHGSDLDNLLKRFFDALNETIFSGIEGKDSCVIELKVKKEQVGSDNEAGVLLKVAPVKKGGVPIFFEEL